MNKIIPKGKFKLDLPLLISFKSQFCSKCAYNKKLLNEAIKVEQIKINQLEEDITSNDGVHTLIKPRSVPYLILVDNKGIVQFEFEGLMNTKVVKSIILMLRHISGS